MTGRRRVGAAIPSGDVAAAADTASPRGRDWTAALLSAPLDPKRGMPLHLQLRFHIVQLVGTGTLPSGALIPSVRTVAEGLGLASATVQRTYRDLVASGLLTAIAGKGTYVGEMSTPGVDTQAGPSELDDLLIAPVTKALSLGLSDDEVHAALTSSLLRFKRADEQPVVGLVGWSGDVNVRYERHLREALSGLRCRVESVPVQTLAGGPDAFVERYPRVRCLVALPPSYGEAHRIAERLGLPLVGLILVMTAETENGLHDLPVDGPIGLIAEPEFIAWDRQLLQQYRGADVALVSATPDDRHACAEIARRCTTVVHTIGTREMAIQLLPPTVRRIELLFQPSDTSLRRVRSIMAAIEASKPSSADPGRASN
jgi:GntR family transcriptional regulator